MRDIGYGQMYPPRLPLSVPAPHAVLPPALTRSRHSYFDPPLAARPQLRIHFFRRSLVRSPRFAQTSTFSIVHFIRKTFFRLGHDLVSCALSQPSAAYSCCVMRAEAAANRTISSKRRAHEFAESEVCTIYNVYDCHRIISALPLALPRSDRPFLPFRNKQRGNWPLLWRKLML